MATSYSVNVGGRVLETYGFDLDNLRNETLLVL